jgi:polar amino acid transport system substrate-binding protein
VSNEPRATFPSGIGRALLLALALAALPAGQGGPAAQTGPAAQAPPPAAPDGPSVRIAVEGAFPPFNFIDQNNELAGFEVDLGKALCEAMAARCTFLTHQWDGIVNGLINRDYDAIMSSVAITEARKKRIAFSRRYYLMPASFMAAKSAEVAGITPEALAGKRIGTTDRSEHAAFLQGLYRDTEIRLYGRLDEAILDLRAERIDLVLGDKLPLTRFLASADGECCRLVGDAPASSAYLRRAVGVALRKEDEDLRALFDKAIEDVKRNGTYDRIRARYFPVDIK